MQIHNLLTGLKEVYEERFFPWLLLECKEAVFRQGKTNGSLDFQGGERHLQARVKGRTLLCKPIQMKMNYFVYCHFYFKIVFSDFNMKM